MRTYVPPYYKKFKCVGGECPSNCCIGWEIDIDEETLARYESMPGEIGERIRKSIDKSGDVSHFRLCEGERCPHLNDKNLCNIIAECGEGALCEICRKHPRYYNEYHDLREIGVGLACPAAAELILLNEDFTVEQIDEADEPLAPADETTLYVLKALRWDIFRMLSMPEHFDMDAVVPFICDNARYGVDFSVSDIESGVFSRENFSPDRFMFPSEPYDEVSKGDMERTRDAYLSLGYLEESFRDEVRAAFNLAWFDTAMYKTEVDFSFFIMRLGEVVFRRLLYYFLHRYMLAGAVDGEYDLRMRHAIICSYLCIAIGYLRGGSFDDILSASIDLSRNIEYDEENLERIIFTLDGDGYLPPLWIGQLFL